MIMGSISIDLGMLLSEVCDGCVSMKSEEFFFLTVTLLMVIQCL